VSTRACRRLAPFTALVATVLLAACGPSIPEPGDNGSAPGLDAPQADRACESQLAHLDELIARRKGELQFPRDRLIEAQALRETAEELCIDAQYDLAHELMDEAEVLLGNS